MLRQPIFFVDVLNNSFSPSTLQINVGDTVTWTSQDEDDDTHTTTSNTGLWNGLLVGLGDQFSRTFASAGTFPYHDSLSSATGSITVLAANTPPLVTITNPIAGATFAAPATFSLQATASDSGGSVASVEFFVGTTSIHTNTIIPYNTTVSNLVAGDYVLSAVATDNSGAKATNSINITVTNPLPVILSSPKIVGGQFQFNISGLVAGKTNFVQVSTNLTDWISIKTNVGTISSFTDTQTVSFSRRFYRLRQLP